MKFFRPLVATGLLVALASAAPAQVARPDTAIPGIGGLTGIGVAIHGDRALVGSTHFGSTGITRIFERQANGSWVHSGSLTPPAFGLHGGGAGRVLALEQDRAVLGFPIVGTVWVYDRQPDGTWLSAPAIESPISPAGNKYVAFGGAVALDGDRLFVTGRTSMFWYFAPTLLCYERQSSGSWSLVAEVHSSTTLVANQELDTSMSLSGDRIAVGGMSNGDSGKVYVFERASSGTWSLTATLESPGAPTGTRFGESVHLDGDRLMVGASYDSAAASFAGAVYVFERDTAGWSHVQTLHGIGASQCFGRSIAGDGPWLIVAAPTTSVAPNEAVHVFHREASGYVERITVAPSHGSGFSSLGASGGTGLAVHDGVAIFGTPGHVLQSLIGGAHIFALGTLYHGHVEMSLATGGTQKAHLRAGPEGAGLFWWMLGSFSGTTPGVPLGGGAVLPLVPDFYTDLALLLALPIFPAIGFLDANGAADADILLFPTAPPSLIGVTIHHAYLTIDPVTLALGASNAARFKIVP